MSSKIPRLKVLHLREDRPKHTPWPCWADTYRALAGVHGLAPQNNKTLEDSGIQDLVELGITPTVNGSYCVGEVG